MKLTGTIKRQKARNAEYYDMQDVQDKLYAESKGDKNFTKLMKLITCDENILLAYRNMKKNKGSYTAGVDGKTIEHFKSMTSEQITCYARKRLNWYKPQAVKRVEIPKESGETRALGIPTIADRLIQQCFLQILDPICEAKFHDRSYGFRPLRSAENAMAVYYKYVQQMNMHYVVDIDIKGFFDNISHGKLLKQMWALGIRDKTLISIISTMLKAEVAGIGFPDKGTPQGGIISPLLANIVLNELDWWISDQWQTFKTRNQYKKTTQKNGTENEAVKFKTLRDYTKLKEGWLVRYADDFKIVCKNKDDAEKWFIAVKLWLKERLNLETSPEKSKVVNLKKHYSEFLGLKVKATRKGFNKRTKKKVPKYVVKSHIKDKAIARITKTARERIMDIIKSSSENDQLSRIGSYNAFVMGMHNYYQMATHVTMDINKIDYQVFRTFERRTKTKLKPYNGEAINQYVRDRYGKSKRLKMLKGKPLIPISYVQTRAPCFKGASVNPYTPQGREAVHKNLTGINSSVLYHMMRNPVKDRSIEYNDNRLSLYCGQQGKCAITGTQLETGEMHCHHIVPTRMGGTDEYANLMLLTTDAHILIHASTDEIISEQLAKLNLNKKQLDKINRLRKKVDLVEL